MIMDCPSNYTVIGAGHGGKTMAAYLALSGKKVTLYNRTYEHVKMIAARGGIELESNEGGLRGFGKIFQVTSDMQTALAEAEVVMVVLPSSAHRDIARLASPFLKDGQILILNPGRTCGAIEFAYVLEANECKADVTVAETETFIYASRSDGPAQARIFRTKNAVPLAALPASRTQKVLDAINDVYPEFIDGVNVLNTGLNNMGAIFHPALTILNAARIESTLGDFQFYIDGVTSSVARVLDALDRERVTVAASIGIRARTAMEWLAAAYNVTGDTLQEAIHNQTGYYGINAPSTMNHRYIFEDVPMSLVPIAALGTRFGVSVRGMDSMIRLACIIHQTDYWRRGRTLDKLGIDHFSSIELLRYVNEGIKPDY
jgi:opine dehydrogenase